MPYASTAEWKVEIVGSATTPITIQGGAADGAPASGNPIPIATTSQAGNTERVISRTGTQYGAGVSDALSVDLLPTVAMMQAPSSLAMFPLSSATTDGINPAFVLMTQVMAFDGTVSRRLVSDTVGTLRTGEHRTVIKNASAVQAALYQTNDLVGGKRTFTSAVRTSGGAGTILGVLVGDQAANAAANSDYDLYIFDSDPTATTFTENSPLDIADADLNKVLAVIAIRAAVGNSYFANVDNAVTFLDQEIEVQASGSTSLFGALIARSATGPTFVATTDLFITLSLRQN